MTTSMICSRWHAERWAAPALVAVLASCSHAPAPQLIHPAWLYRETTVPASGRLEYSDVRVVSSEVSATLETLLVAPGTHVRTGQEIAVLESPEISANAAAATAALDEARADLQAARTNAARGPQERRAALARAAAARSGAFAALESARFAAANGSLSEDAGGTAAQRRAAVDEALTKAMIDDQEAQHQLAIDQALYADRAIALQSLRNAQDAAHTAAATLQAAQAARRQTYAALERVGPILAQRQSAAASALTAAQRGYEQALTESDELLHSRLAAARAAAAARESAAEFAAGRRAALTVRAPADGVIDSIASSASDEDRPLQNGESVAAGTRIATLRLDDRLIVRASVDEQDMGRIRTGEPARITSGNLGSRPLRGTVVGIDPRIRQTSDGRRVTVLVRLSRPAPALASGSDVDVTFVTDRRRVLTVPVTALAYNGGKPQLFVAAGAGVEPVPVSVSPIDVNRVAVQGRIGPDTAVVGDPYR